ncbi:MAG: glutamine amidotransferase-related protein [Bryobacteraceae bacterium]
MKILVVNNYQHNNETATFEALKLSLSGHQVEYQRYRPGLQFADAGKDLIIISGGGGEGSEINDRYTKDKLWYEDQINFILSTKKPILGICMGFEVIARAYGSKVFEMGDYTTGFKRSKTTRKGLEVYKKPALMQYESHKWRVPSVPSKYFEVLAQSKTGVEIIKHKTRPIIATQFHPEKGGTLRLFSFIGIVTS